MELTCTITVSQKSKVAPHERTHTGEKPYACSMCPRRFAHESNVVQHERNHSGKQIYASSYTTRAARQGGKI